MKNLFVLGVLFLFLTSNSCRKDKSSMTFVTGIVSEKGTGNPIEGATVFLGRKDKNSFSGLSIQTVKTVICNVNGEYSFEYEEEEDYTYVVIVRKVPYYESIFYYPRKGEKNLLNISLAAPSYLKLKIKNISGADRLAIGYPCSCTFYGTTIDTTTNPISINSYENLKYYWLIYKYSIDTIKDSASIFIPAFDTTIINLNY